METTQNKEHNMIKIRKSPSADTRSADHVITRDELLLSTEMHISDVRKALKFLSRKLYSAALLHDHTKLSRFVEFYEQFHEAQTTGHWGVGWFDQIHIVEERHHLKDNCPEDVNLIDVLEMLCDCVMAGLARTGHYREEEPDAEILVKAYKNTVKMLIENTEVKQ